MDKETLLGWAGVDGVRDEEGDSDEQVEIGQVERLKKEKEKKKKIEASQESGRDKEKEGKKRIRINKDK